MTRIILVLLIMVSVTIMTYIIATGYYRVERNHRSKHWIPGSKPMARPSPGKRWTYDPYREEWYEEDKE